DIIVVLDAEVDRHSEFVVSCRIGHDSVSEVAVRNSDFLVIERVELRDTELDLFDNALIVIPLDPITDCEWFVLDDENARDEVGDEVLCSKPNSERECT